jgi:diadenosine tetraphosphate (Ap4A) HIT family hydrolase
MPVPFVLDPRLEADGPLIARVEGCQLRLVDDARFPWLVLIPEDAGASEIFDLPETRAATVLALATRLGAAMKAAFAADKINLGLLGNMVPQLHLHIVARRKGDDAWPGPVWGAGTRRPMPETEKAARCAAFRKLVEAS